MTLKEKIYQHYLQVVQHSINDLQQVLTDLKESGTNETKSTAGDKHETALAMLQIEQANVRNQLKQVQEQLAVMQKINPALSPVAIVPGSLIKTNRGYLFLSIAAGKGNIDGHTVIALSPQSPLGKQLVGLNIGDTACMNHVYYRIEEIG
jgi:transcription elongation GreA/GreB family factor